LLYEGMFEEAMNVIRTVDQRYRDAGLYFNHQECGGHYYRAMSAWAILDGLLGLSRRAGTISFAPNLPVEEFTVFFALPGATAHYISAEKGRTVELRVFSGSLEFDTLNFSKQKFNSGGIRVLLDGTPMKASSGYRDGTLTVRFAEKTSLKEGRTLTVRCR
jgi:hypothetical protein